MQKFDVQIALEKVGEARREWTARQREFQSGVDSVLAVLFHEAARCYMSADEIAKASGLTTKQVRDRMKRLGLHPSAGKRALSDYAAKALAENAELLGVKPQDMDLTSPLVYLPMGNDLRSQLQDQRNAQVTDLPEDVACEMCGDVPGPDAPTTYCGDCDAERPVCVNHHCVVCGMDA